MIVGLCGFIGAGKTSVAEYLVNKHGFQRMSFAAKVKDVASILFDWPRDRLEGKTFLDRQWREVPDSLWSEIMGHPFTKREGLQLVGNELRESIHADIWVYSAISAVNALGPDAKVVFDDVRYVNERNVIRESGGKLYTVHRADDRGLRLPSDEHSRLWLEATDDQVLSSEETPLHRSEWDWLRDNNVDRDPILANADDLESLYKTVEEVLIPDILTLK